MRRLTKTTQDDTGVVGGDRRFRECIGCRENCYWCSLQKEANNKLSKYEDLEQSGRLMKQFWAPTVNQWTKINCPEDLPPRGTTALVIWKDAVDIAMLDRYGGWINVGVNPGYCNVTAENNRERRIKVTHWMPLPQPPAEE